MKSKVIRKLYIIINILKRFIMKNYDEWNIIKQKANKKENKVGFKEREIL